MHNILNQATKTNGFPYKPQKTHSFHIINVDSKVQKEIYPKNKTLVHA